ncbi:hypothetical protein WAL18_31980 [Waltera acetigignens]
MPETTPLIKAALNLRVGAGFDVYPLTDKWYRCLYLWQFLFRVQLVKRHDEYD